MLSPTGYLILYSTIKSHSVFADVTASGESRCHSCISMDTSSIFKETVPFDSEIYSRTVGALRSLEMLTSANMACVKPEASPK